ncbi:hypothetical protein [Yinghuangia soli]|uniref:Uncharacterized protein n=1 Tax=Yinghuangia soli TaxID=2908204 RepID=A0AA41Q569_9ACTN|nr:hypothetical protein [Yinghuangia soli]MCF2531170.1 hypothetical protein [Yinghuangia soli]
MHLHVGQNIPGYLPGAEPMCFSVLASAIEAYRHELRDLQGDYAELCAATTDELQNGCCECAWCDVATDVEAVLSAIADGDVAYALTHASDGEQRSWNTTFRPPEGADVCVWITAMTDALERCELAEVDIC